MSLGQFGGDAPVVDGLLYAMSANTLFAFDPATFEEVWRFAPAPAHISESMYGSFTVADGLLFIGDLAGKLHALDAATGTSRWVKQTNRQVIATALVRDGRVFFANNAGRAFCLEAATGESCWEAELGSSSLHAVMTLGDRILIGATTSISSLDAGTGAVETLATWPGERARHIFAMDGWVFVARYMANTEERVNVAPAPKHVDVILAEAAARKARPKPPPAPKLWTTVTAQDGKATVWERSFVDWYPSDFMPAGGRVVLVGKRAVFLEAKTGETSVEIEAAGRHATVLADRLVIMPVKGNAVECANLPP